MNYENIVNKINNGAYNVKTKRTEKEFKENHIFDEDKSVKWNREEVIRRNELIKNAVRPIYKDEFKEDLIEYILGYEVISNKTQAERIYAKAWEDGHIYGFYNVLQELEDLMDFVEDII